MSKAEPMEQKIEPIDLIAILVDFTKVLRKMWIHVLILTILLGVVLGARSYLNYRPCYTASGTFTINIRKELSDGTSSDSTFFDNAAAEQMAKTFPYILTSGVLQRRVAQSMGTSSISGEIKAYVAENTNLLTITVTDTDGQRAYDTLQTVIENYPVISEGIIGKVNMELLDETGVPTEPDYPRQFKRSAVKGALLGMLLGLVWVALVVISRKTIRREEDCMKLVNSRCLGVIPQQKQKARSNKNEQTFNLLQDNINSGFEEAFRIIRNKVEKIARSHDMKVILMTSAMASEGKSTSSVNLALSLAMEGKRVALVDCDLRHPSDSEILGIKTNQGLSEYLKGKVSINDVLLMPMDMNIDNNIRLVYLPGGSQISDGSALLGGDKMRRVLDAIKQQVDYVILDTPPVGMMTDAGILAQYADGAIFVVKKDFARADHILEGMEHLADGHVHLMGCIINGD